MAQNPSATEHVNDVNVSSDTGASVPGRTDQRLHDEKVARKMARVLASSRKDRKEVERIISDALPILDRLLDQE